LRLKTALRKKVRGEKKVAQPAEGGGRGDNEGSRHGAEPSLKGACVVSVKVSKSVSKSSPKVAGRSAVEEPGGAPPPRTPGELAGSLGVELKPPLKTNQVVRLRRALPGYVNALDNTAELLEQDGAVLGFDEATPARLVDMQRRYKKLRTAETLLETVHQSVYHQRLQLDDEAMGLLQSIVRRVQSRAEEDPQMPLRWGALLDFMGAFRKGGGRAAPAPVEPEAPAGDGEL
jgi:hypothetical protein